MSSTTLHDSCILPLNACSAEFCPSPLHRNFLAIGTYQLQDKSNDEHQGERIGRLFLYSVHQRGKEDGGHQLSLSHVEPSPSSRSSSDLPGYLPGIFDLKWSRGYEEEPILAAAMADGSIRLYKLLSSTLSTHQGFIGDQGLQELSRCQACTHPANAVEKIGNMSLSLDWDPFEQTRIVVSGSKGSLSIVQATESGSKLEREVEWQGHSLEAWCVAFSHQHRNLVYSGSDDAILKAWDLRMDLDLGPSSDPSPPQSIFVDRKTHGAGVCTISPHPLSPHLIATGSYDEKVRVWDARSQSKPLLIAEVGTGGGNWRLRWHPTNPTLLLAACMYNGAAVIQWDQEKEDKEDEGSIRGHLKVKCCHEGHESITYGADWYRDEGDKKSMLAATCSFYDRSLHLWSISE